MKKEKVKTKRIVKKSIICTLDQGDFEGEIDNIIENLKNYKKSTNLKQVFIKLDAGYNNISVDAEGDMEEIKLIDNSRP